MSHRPATFLRRLREVRGRHPDAPALVSPTRRILDRELPGLVGRVAAGLARRGVGRGDVVGLFLPRSPDFVLGVLACWSLGAAFVPVSEAMPAARRDEMLAETGARVILGHEPLGDDPAPPEYDTRPGDLAYVIHTSGSTGRPKGVAVEHRGLLNLFDAQIAAFGLGPDSRCLWILGTTFDATVSDIGTALLSGAALYMTEDDCVRDPDALTAALRRWEITHLDIPPALLRVLDPGRMPASLRTLIVGGEPSPPEVIRRWAGRFRVVNVYGPTEATVCSSLCVCDPLTWTEPLLGAPLPGVRYHVVDDELLIEGDCLARGYVNVPEATAGRFVLHEGRRAYRTGDRVRRRGDDFVFLGRIDRQVKLHGLRIEPGEIEAALLALGGVERAAVVLRERAGEPILAAFWSGTRDEVRSGLAETLPAWMIPSACVRLDAMPLTEGGKVDTAALLRYPLAGEETPPRSGLGGLLTEILGVAPDWDRSFLEQGGDSFAVLRLAAAASSRGWSLSPGVLAGPTPLREAIGEMHRGDAMDADALRRDAEGVHSSLPAFPPGGTPDERAPVLLTGATGFLGSHLLGELFHRSSGEIVCLVRARSEAGAVERLRRASPVPVGGRVRVVCGDLDRPKFGLPDEAYARLSAEVGAVYHSAAGVDLVADYAALRRTNLLGTAEVLRFAATGRAKEVHHVSTLSVFVATDRNAGTLLEGDALAETSRVYGGYAQSKWAAEWLVRRAAGARVAIYRPGLIVGGRDDFLAVFIRGLVRLGCVPPVDAAGLTMDITPVDFAARAIAFLSTREPVAGSTYHIAGAGPLSLERLLGSLARLGRPIDRVSFSAWEKRLWGAGPSAAAGLALCRGLPTFERWRAFDLFQATGVTFDMRATTAGLVGSGIGCEPPDDAWLDRYVARALEAERER